jgi:hypothetical protein
VLPAAVGVDAGLLLLGRSRSLFWLIVLKKKANSRRPEAPKALTRHRPGPQTPKAPSPSLSTIFEHHQNNAATAASFLKCASAKSTNDRVFADT